MVRDIIQEQFHTECHSRLHPELIGQYFLAYLFIGLLFEGTRMKEHDSRIALGYARSAAYVLRQSRDDDPRYNSSLYSHILVIWHYGQTLACIRAQKLYSTVAQPLRVRHEPCSLQYGALRRIPNKLPNKEFNEER